MSEPRLGGYVKSGEKNKIMKIRLLRRLAVVAVIATSLALGGAGASASPVAASQPCISTSVTCPQTIWSGYSMFPNSGILTAVSADWTVPTVVAIQPE